MLLDKTRVVIRQRSWSEIMDLSLLVVRQRALPLAFWLVAGALPFVILNAVFLNWYDDGTLERGLRRNGLPNPWYLIRMAFLMAWEMPMATAPLTIYLGKVMFDAKANAASVARDFLESLPQLVVYQVLRRGLALAFFFTAWIPFTFQTFLSEIILLERNPMREKPLGHGRDFKLSRTTGARSLELHRGQRDLLFGQWIFSLLIGGVLLLAIFRGALSFRYLLFRETDDVATYSLYLPIAAWLVIGYFTVTRFLRYLDLRIRNEGWELQLRFREEALKLTRRLA